MAITERTLIGKMEILEDNRMLIRDDTILERGTGKELARTFHRRVLEPGQDTSGETDPRLLAVIAALWTPAAIAAYQVLKQSRQIPGLL